MNKLLIRAAAATSSAALVLSSLVGPALADEHGMEVVIEGNLANSDNTANVAVQNQTTVTQTNYSDISNDVNVKANTGKNDANYNHGDASIKTGDAMANVGVNNTANANFADVNGCCPQDLTVKIKDNGAYTDNDANVAFQSKTTVDQDNTAYVKNDVDVDLDTGKNDANYNGGSASIKTGHAMASDPSDPEENGGVHISNMVNKNVASVNNGPNGGGSLSVWITGNLANSDNTANVAVASVKTVMQTNYANISNDVDVDADTGRNDANYNHGDASIETGDAMADVWVSNLANFNAADVDACGCILDLTVKIKDNGAYTDNDANVVLASATVVDQDNTFECGHRHHREGWEWHKKNCNDVDVDLDTGKNDANYNGSGEDPLIDTGDAMANDVMVETEANVNVVGDADVEFPDFPDFPDLDGDSESLLVWLLLAMFS